MSTRCLRFSSPTPSRTKTLKSYRINLTNTSSPSSYTLAVSLPTPGNSEYSPNSLVTVEHLHGLIKSQTSIPLPNLLKSGTLSNYDYLLLSAPREGISVAAARRSGLLTSNSDARIAVFLGTYLRQLHNIQNDWFGLPSLGGKEPADPSYSWQESFTLFLETVLTALESSSAVKIPFVELRSYLSRAIGFYLFDDVEVPSLIGFTVSEEDVIISSSFNDGATPDIIYFPMPTHALWGDPMMETFLMPPGPSRELLEAYMSGEDGGPLFVFPRQRTKRLWYTLFLAGVVLLEGNEERDKGDLKWAREAVAECVTSLKNAPYY